VFMTLIAWSFHDLVSRGDLRSRAATFLPVKGREVPQRCGRFAAGGWVCHQHHSLLPSGYPIGGWHTGNEPGPTSCFIDARPLSNETHA
jgi:hypothetical protein